MSGTAIPLVSRLTLAADTAAELMSPNPVSLRAAAAVQEAIPRLPDRGFGPAPVIDEAGQPLGVVSRSDILVHEREHGRHARLDDAADRDTPPRRRRHEGYEVEVVDRTQVRDIMTPVVFTVTLTTPAAEVVGQMLRLKVHHLFVVDATGCLVGVISSLDVLRRLQPPQSADDKVTR